jgi:hypothetical protein
MALLNFRIVVQVLLSSLPFRTCHKAEEFYVGGRGNQLLCLINRISLVESERAKLISMLLLQLMNYDEESRREANWSLQVNVLDITFFLASFLSLSILLPDLTSICQ